MIKTMTFKRAGKKDLSGIYNLILEATRRGKILKRSRADLARNIHHFWVAEEDGQALGCCALEIYNKKLAEIRSLVVRADQQKKGIATALIDHCLKEARKKRIYEVLAITDRENLFRRHGFSEQLHGQKSLFFRP